jgi:hypothetical protein
MKHIYIADFAREEELLAAVAIVRRRQWPVLEAYTPYPVHGLDAAMGLRPSKLGKVCFLWGLLGVAVAVGFQYWSTAINWPLNVGGQPWNSWPAFLPVAFETMVLFAGLGLFLSLLVRCGLAPGNRSWSPGRGETDNRFVLVLGEQPGLAVDTTHLQQLLEDCGATSVESREC